MQTDVSAVVLIPTEFSVQMLVEGTSIPEVDVSEGEVAWSPTFDYTGVEDNINHEGWLYSSVAPSKGVKPNQDTTKWRLTGPSNRMAPFDDRLDTKARSTGTMKYVIRPGFISGLYLWGVIAESVIIKVFDEPDGEVVNELTTDLFEQAVGLYELLFMPLARTDQIYLENLGLWPDTQVEIELIVGAAGQASLALVSLGFWDTIKGSSTLGGVEYGAQAEVKSYSYLKRNDDGTVTRIRRGSSDNLSFTIVVSSEQGNHAMDILRKVQGRPVAYIATGIPEYAYLNGFGDITGSVTAENYGMASVNLELEGAVQQPRSVF